jgi:hypothetical protein
MSRGSFIKVALSPSLYALARTAAMSAGDARPKQGHP